MTVAMRQPASVDQVAEAARLLGRKGGRPLGSTSSPLAAWIRTEVKEKRREGWGRREAFNIAADTEQKIDRDHFLLSDWTADEAGIETVDEEGNDQPAVVSWSNWKKIWLEGGHGNRFP